MLARILEEMKVEPEVLEALSEEQKRILFFKMREEQVRRWREREETQGSEDHAGPTPASRKHVTWLLGRDGDVRVSVIGEEDELRSSKLLQSLLNNRYQDARGTDDQPAASLPQRGVAGRARNPLVHSQSLEGTLCPGTARGGQPADAPSDGDRESGCSRDNLHHRWAPLHEPRSRRHGNRPPLGAAQSLDADGRLPLARAALTEEEEDDLAFEARVAQFNKICGTQTAVTPKPPIPARPPHLQRADRSVPRPVPEAVTAS